MKGRKVLGIVLAATMALTSVSPVLAADKVKISFMSRDSGDTPMAKVYEDQIAAFMEENPDQIRHNADKLYLNVKKMMVYMMEATKEMCTRIDHMENLQGRSFADDILPGYQSEEELEALEEQRQKEQRKSFWSSLFGKKEK